MERGAKQKVSSMVHYVRAQIKEFNIPPIHDGLVLGKKAPIGCEAIRRALSLLSSNRFDHIELDDDDIISDILVRAAIVRKLTQEKLIAFVLQKVKPLMSDEEILHLDLQVEVLLEEEV